MCFRLRAYTGFKSSVRSAAAPTSTACIIISKRVIDILALLVAPRVSPRGFAHSS